MPEVAVRTLAGRAGDPVVVLGPSLGTRVDRLWGTVAAELAASLHVVGWDLPGHGRSPVAAGPFTLADVADAVLAAVEAELRAETLLYAGDSVGGAVGLQLALAHPDRLAAVAVLCSAARFGDPTAWSARAALVRAEGMAPMVESSPGRWFGSRVQADSTDATQAAVADLAEVDAESYALVCEAIGGFDVVARLGEVSTPLLAVAGADDVATPAAGMQELASKVAAGRFAVLRGVGHLAPLEDPARTAALLREHFARAIASAG